MLPEIIAVNGPRSSDRRLANFTAAVTDALDIKWVLVCALLLRVALLWASAGIPVQITDERDYYKIATNIVEGNGFAEGPGLPTSIRPPLYPGFIAGLWTITGSRTLLPIRIAHILIALASVVLVYRIAKQLFDQRTAVIAASVFAFYPTLLFLGVLILTETIFVFFLLLTISACLATLRDGSPWSAFAGGVCLGLAALTRSVLWPFLLVLGPFLWFVSAGAFRRRSIAFAAMLAGYAVVVGPWAVRNTRLQNTLTIVDTMSGINLLTGNYEYTPEDRMWDGVSLGGSRGWYVPMVREHPGRDFTEGEKDKWARSAAVQFITAHPALTLKRSVLKLADLWGLEREWIAGIALGLFSPPLWFAVISSALTLLVYPVILGLALLGLFLVRDNDARARWLFVLLAGFLCLAHAATFGHSRYHLPLVPVFAIYGAAAITHSSAVIARFTTKRALALAPTLLMVLCALIWTREVFLRDADHIARLVAALQHL